MIADNSSSEISIDTQCMGKFQVVRDSLASADELYPFRIAYEPTGVMEQMCSQKSKRELMSKVQQQSKDMNIEEDVQRLAG